MGVIILKKKFSPVLALLGWGYFAFIALWIGSYALPAHFSWRSGPVSHVALNRVSVSNGAMRYSRVPAAIAARRPRIWRIFRRFRAVGRASSRRLVRQIPFSAVQFVFTLLLLACLIATGRLRWRKSSPNNVSAMRDRESRTKMVLAYIAPLAVLLLAAGAYAVWPAAPPREKYQRFAEESRGGIVCNRRNGRPLAGARVELFENNILAAAVKTDADGKFRVRWSGPYFGGRLFVVVSAHGYRRWQGSPGRAIGLTPRGPKALAGGPARP